VGVVVKLKGPAASGQIVEGALILGLFDALLGEPLAEDSPPKSDLLGPRSKERPEALSPLATAGAGAGIDAEAASASASVARPASGEASGAPEHATKYRDRNRAASEITDDRLMPYLLDPIPPV